MLISFETLNTKVCIHWKLCYRIHEFYGASLVNHITHRDHEYVIQLDCTEHKRI